MNAVQAWTRPAPMDPTPIEIVDAAVRELRGNADRWVATGIEARIELLRAVLRNLGAEADAWIATARELKGIEPGTNPEGQEWLSGYLAIPRSVRYFIHTLSGTKTVPEPNKGSNGSNKGGARGSVVVQKLKSSASLINRIRGMRSAKTSSTSSMSDGETTSRSSKERPAKTVFLFRSSITGWSAG